MHGSHRATIADDDDDDVETDYQEPLSKSFPAINEDCLTKLMQMTRED